MKKFTKVLLIITIVVAVIFSIGFIGLKILQHQLEEKITGCKIENSDFLVTIPFDYVSNWIVINTTVPGIENDFPFMFDTGAQTVVLDSFLNVIGEAQFDKFTFTEKTDSVKHAFNNELISIHDLSLKGVNFKDIGAISAKNSKWEMLNCISPYGVLGYNVLQTFYSNIDYENQQIIITDQLENIPNIDKAIWVNYTPSDNQETPIITAYLNDSIKMNLMFDTGFSGGISINSKRIYNKIINEYPDRYNKYISKSSIRIRGESDETFESLNFMASKISIGDMSIEDFKVNVSYAEENEFVGFIGNKFFENYAITLDYQNRRIGFSKKPVKKPEYTSYGFSYNPANNKLYVNTVFEDSEAFKMNIKPGDEIYSINDIVISDLSADDFCQIYRNEYILIDPADSIIKFKTIKDGKILEFNLKKYELF